MSVKIGGTIHRVNASYETSPAGKRVTRISLTAEQVAEAFLSSPAGILIEAQNIGDTVKLDLPAAPLLNALKRQHDAQVELRVNGNGVRIPLAVISSLPKEASLTATIGTAAKAASGAWNDSIVRSGGTPLLSRPAVYSLQANGGDIADWSRLYAIRTVSLPTPANPEKATAVRVDANGRLHFAPSVFSNDGKPIATIRSLYDGVYTVIETDRSFADLNGHWARQDIVLMANKRIAEGRGQDRFVPDENVTRAEFAALLVRALGLDEGSGETPFRDVAADAWYAGVVRTACRAGWIDGYGDGTFRPSEYVTREQMAAMIDRAMEYAGYSPNAGDAPKKTFADQAGIAKWAATAVERLTAASILQGMNDTEFDPRGQASRAQSAVMVKRMLEALRFING